VSRPVDLPSEARARTAMEQLLSKARGTGTQPSVLALARQFGLTNTTFRRHFPELAKEIAAARSTPSGEAPATSPGATRYDRLVARNAKLRRANQGLTDHLKIAAAHIQRLTLENHRLRQELEGAANVTRIGPQEKRGGHLR
jgi:transposase-like protein